ncbi:MULTISPECIES: hypothetical protein [Afipia]|nr:MULTISPECIES: hypothetical protein [Afipia]
MSAEATIAAAAITNTFLVMVFPPSMEVLNQRYEVWFRSICDRDGI